MRRQVKTILVSILAVLASPLLLLFLLSPKRDLILKDALRWAEVLRRPPCPPLWTLLLLLAEHQEFRNLYYYRICRGSLLATVLAQLFKVVYSELPTLSISARGEIGPGLFIQHGFATIIAADSIGTNCFVSQQVTIGYRNRTDCPRLGDNVVVTAGAKVIGGITLSDGVVVGANAVVVKDVPPRCVVVGVPARIVRRDGVRVDQPLP
jgi:serine O-acetyltransferase